jgi:hypothetical protein
MPSKTATKPSSKAKGTNTRKSKALAPVPQNPFIPHDFEPLFEPLGIYPLRQLRKFASHRKVPKYSRLTKPQLIEALD